MSTQTEGSYFDVFGKPDDEREYKQMCETLDRLGCYCVITEYFDGCPVCERGSWEMADSLGMCVYENPLSPYENCYVIQMMQEAIKKIDG